MIRKLIRKKPKLTPAQLEAKLKEAGYEWHELTASQWHTIQSSALGPRYKRVLRNQGPYRKFVLAYLDTLTNSNVPDHVRLVAHAVMEQAVNGMRSTLR